MDMTKEQEMAAKYIIMHNVDNLSDEALREVIQTLNRRLAIREMPTKLQMENAFKQAKNLLVKAHMDGYDVDDKLCVRILEPYTNYYAYNIPLAHIVEAIEKDEPLAVDEYEESVYDDTEYGLREAYVSEGCPEEYKEQFSSLLKYLDIYDITDRVRK